MAEIGRIIVVDVELGAQVPPEGFIVYARDTDKSFLSDGTTLTEITTGGGGLDVEGAQDAIGSITDSTIDYNDATPSLSRAALTGDVTAAAGSNSTTIANDAVTDAKLRNSAALSVIGRSANSSGDPADIAGATVGHVLQVLSGPTLGFGASTGNGPAGSQYDPKRQPASLGTGGFYENFIGGSSTYFATWVNQGASTATHELDGLTIDAPASSTGNMRLRCEAAPASGDFTLHALMSGIIFDNYNQFGIALLQGTTGTPTRIDTLAVSNTNGSNTTFVTDRWASPTSWTSNHFTMTAFNETSGLTMEFYLRIAFTDSSKSFQASVSRDGRLYFPVGSAVNIGANPAYACLVVDSSDATFGVSTHIQFAEVRTDASMAWPGQ